MVITSDIGEDGSTTWVNNTLGWTIANHNGSISATSSITWTVNGQVVGGVSIAVSAVVGADDGGLPSHPLHYLYISTPFDFARLIRPEVSCSASVASLVSRPAADRAVVRIPLALRGRRTTSASSEVRQVVEYVDLTILNANDQPTFTLSATSGSLVEGSSSAQAIALLAGQDADAGDTVHPAWTTLSPTASSLAWADASHPSGAAGDWFSLSATAGGLVLSNQPGKPIAYKDYPALRLVVTAHNPDTTYVRSSGATQCTVTVAIENRNDPPRPAGVSGSWVVSAGSATAVLVVPEQPTLGSNLVLATLGSADDDRLGTISGPETWRSVTWSFAGLSSATAPLAIVGDQLLMTGPMTFADWRGVTLTGLARPANPTEPPLPGSADCALTITIADADDPGRLLGTVSTQTLVPENSVGATVAQVTVQDPDLLTSSPDAAYNRHRFTVQAGLPATSALAAVRTGVDGDRATYDLVLVQPLDYEAFGQAASSAEGTPFKTLLLTLQLADGAAGAAQGSATLRLADVNEPPVISGHQAIGSGIPENSRDATVVAHVAGSDPDAGSQPVWSCSDARFRLSPTATGAFLVWQPPVEAASCDRETATGVPVTVTLADQAFSATRAWSVAILDREDAPAVSSWDDDHPTVVFDANANTRVVVPSLVGLTGRNGGPGIFPATRSITLTIRDAATVPDSVGSVVANGELRFRSNASLQVGVTYDGSSGESWSAATITQGGIDIARATRISSGSVISLALSGIDESVPARSSAALLRAVLSTLIFTDPNRGLSSETHWLELTVITTQNGHPTNTTTCTRRLIYDPGQEPTDILVAMRLDPLPAIPASATSVRLMESLPAGDDAAILLSASHTWGSNTFTSATAGALRYTLVSPPRFGRLFHSATASTPLDQGAAFTQAEINAGRLTYQHNGVDTTRLDGFIFTVDDTGPGHDYVSPYSQGRLHLLELQLTASNNPPWFSRRPTLLRAMPGRPLVFGLEARDLDGDDLRFTVEDGNGNLLLAPTQLGATTYQSLPNGTRISSSFWSITPPRTEVGDTATLTVRAEEDGSGFSTSATCAVALVTSQASTLRLVTDPPMRCSSASFYHLIQVSQACPEEQQKTLHWSTWPRPGQSAPGGFSTPPLAFEASTPAGAVNALRWTVAEADRGLWRFQVQVETREEPPVNLDERDSTSTYAITDLAYMPVLLVVDPPPRGSN